MDGSEYAFERPVRCVIGRGEDCTVRLPNKGWESMMVSRHHCFLDIDPPHITVRDLGSRNGTYINGRLIGLRGNGESPTDAADFLHKSYELKDGDVLSVGPMSFTVKATGVKIAKELVETASEAEPADVEKVANERPDSMLLAI
jgi:pSer/pThr/pTyr-binding forkhead associated (FHA) protein